MTKQQILSLYGIKSYESNKELEKELTDEEVAEFQKDVEKFASKFAEIYKDSNSDEHDIQQIKEQEAQKKQTCVIFSIMVMILQNQKKAKG